MVYTPMGVHSMRLHMPVTYAFSHSDTAASGSAQEWSLRAAPRGFLELTGEAVSPVLVLRQWFSK